MSRYLAAAAVERLKQAQFEVDMHVAAGVDGRCLGCGQAQPCTALRQGSASFARYGCLPVRRPGLASRGLWATTLVDGFGR